MICQELNILHIPQMGDLVKLLLAPNFIVLFNYLINPLYVGYQTCSTIVLKIVFQILPQVPQ